ncbi:metallophosphoesterase family protein [Membranihabitans maritimus]|uniref:metallophosphoesterase family protein n=1 Tax=Membranihabitans maritimus TaxID=2904244 RepID=UPI001F2EB0E7|nr:metallophosphoesterase [Membranihabitans maritimus]
MTVDFRIIQVTDMHTGRDTDFPLGVHLRNNIQNILEDVERINPNLIVFTGDFCLKEPDLNIYNWIKPQIENLGIPFEIISGNHDNTAMMTTALLGEDLTNEKGEYYFSDKIQERQILYLDSSSGKISPDQFQWIKGEVEKANGSELTVFIHHPPIEAGVPHMDKRYQLEEYRSLLGIFYEYENTVNIFCGHYHVDRTIISKNINIFITPSLYMQIHPFFEEFQVDHYKIGYRIIDFTSQGMITSVRYLPGSRF